MICCRHATGPLIAPVARDISNYRFVRQIGFKTLLLVVILIISILVLILLLLYFIVGYILRFSSSYHMFIDNF